MASLLDNPQEIARIDGGNLLDAIYHFADPFLDPPRPAKPTPVTPKSLDGLVLAGMGGSASSGDVLLDWLREEIAGYALVSREARLPRFAGKATLVICFSYSGETWETLHAFKEARNRGCHLAAVGSGGELEKLCGKSRAPFFRVASGQVPRAALGQMVVAGWNALEHFDIIKGTRRELMSAGGELARMREKLVPQIPSSSNKAKGLALLLRNRFPVIYGFQRMSSVARRFKNQLAENSKMMAKYELLPEAGHNEVESWRAASKSCIPILIRDSRESPGEQAMVRAFKLTISGQGKPRPLDVRITSKSRLGGLLAPILLLDYVSAYLAMLKGVDPSPTPEIRRYKQNTVIA